MRVILDTNVVVSALLWGGSAARIFQSAAKGRVSLYSSPELIDELAGILNRPHIDRKIAGQGLTASQIVNAYRDAVTPVAPSTTPRIVPRDPKDDKLIACALAAGADFIVTGDKHVLSLKNIQGIAIVTVAEINAILKAFP